MKDTPHDLGTFLVPSRTRAGSHIVDIRETTCSCEGFSNYGTCRHLREMLLKHSDLRERLLARPVMTIPLRA